MGDTKGFWKLVLKAGAQIALYAANHPDEVVQYVNTVKEIKEAVKPDDKTSTKPVQ